MHVYSWQCLRFLHVYKVKKKKRFVIIIISSRFLLRNIYIFFKNKKPFDKNNSWKAWKSKKKMVQTKKINHGGMVEEET